MNIDNCLVLFLPRKTSDSIRALLMGPFVNALANTFYDIERVRREGGFEHLYDGRRDNVSAS